MGLFDVGGKFKPRNVAGVQSSRFIEPHDCEEIAEWRVKYANADKLAREIGPLPENFRAIVILDGKFIMGDFIEALIVRNNWLCEELTISTLSMSQENVDSFRNLVKGGYLKSLNLIVSVHHFAHERAGLMPYLYEKLDMDRDGYEFQMAVANVHTKITMIRTACGKKIAIHGSANMRSSANIEQMVIENNAEVFDFFAEAHHRIIKAHATINRAVRHGVLWAAVLGEQEWQQEATNQSKAKESQKSTDKSEQQRKDAAPSAARKAGI